MFEKLLKPVMEERTKQDRIKGSLFLMKSLKAQINALMILMNNEYLKLMNITILKEVIYKYLDPTCISESRNGLRKQILVGITYFQEVVGYSSRRKLE